jgi:hypothetical protein
MYLDLFGIMLSNEDDVRWFINGIRDILKPCVKAKGKVNMVVNYEGFDLSNHLEELYCILLESLQSDMYLTTKRYTGQAFQRARLSTTLNMSKVGFGSDSAASLFDTFDTRRDGQLSIEELREGFSTHFHMSLSPEQIQEFVGENSDPVVDRDAFVKGVKAVLKEVDQKK